MPALSLCSLVKERESGRYRSHGWGDWRILEVRLLKICMYTFLNISTLLNNLFKKMYILLRLCSL